MDLFIIENSIAKPSEHALLVEPFKTIWEQDKSKTKAEAIKAFTYIELNCSMKKSNPFSGYSDVERPLKVAKEVYKDETYKATLVQIEAMKVYREFLEEASPTLSFYKANLKAAEILKANLNTIDLNERTNGGAAVTKPADVTRALKDAADVIKTLRELESQVNTELLEKTKTRGQRDIGEFER
jgi:hypothetical protein